MPSSTKPPKSSPPAALEVDKSGARALAMVRTALIEKKMTQAELADAADCHEKTIQNLLAGRSVRQQTLFDVCMVLGLDYEAVRTLWSGGGSEHGPARDAGRNEAPDVAGRGGDVAPTYMGAYTKAAIDHYVGSYLTVRPALSRPDTVVAYRTDISWEPEWPSLLFEERDRPDAPYSHRGRLYIPPSSQFLHLVSLTKGAMRMVVVSQLDRTGHMRGLITTLNKRGAMFVPVATPIVYLKTADFSSTPLGELPRQHAAYDGYRRMLADAVADGYASLVAVS